MYNKSENGEKIYIIYLKAVGRGLLMSIILLLITALVFYLSRLNQSYMNTIVWIILILSIAYTGIYASGQIASKGYLHGAICGMIYIVLVDLIGVLYSNGHSSVTSYVIMGVMALVIGALSGMIGMMINNN